jgi:hypothetical protein
MVIVSFLLVLAIIAIVAINEAYVDAVNEANKIELSDLPQMPVPLGEEECYRKTIRQVLIVTEYASQQGWITEQLWLTHQSNLLKTRNIRELRHYYYHYMLKDGVLARFLDEHEFCGINAVN